MSTRRVAAGSAATPRPARRSPLETPLVRHGLAGGLGVMFTYLFWLSRPQWDPEMRFWKSIGDASLILLYVTMSLGPITRLTPSLGRIVLLRREIGVWFGLFALLHTYLILDGWVRWDIMRFFGYEFVPQAGRNVRLESGFGMANLLGLAAVVIAIPSWPLQPTGPSRNLAEAHGNFCTSAPTSSSGSL